MVLLVDGGRAARLHGRSPILRINGPPTVGLRAQRRLPEARAQREAAYPPPAGCGGQDWATSPVYRSRDQGSEALRSCPAPRRALLGSAAPLPPPHRDHGPVALALVPAATLEEEALCSSLTGGNGRHDQRPVALTLGSVGLRVPRGQSALDARLAYPGALCAEGHGAFTQPHYMGCGARPLEGRPPRAARTGSPVDPDGRGRNQDLASRFGSAGAPPPRSPAHREAADMAPGSGLAAVPRVSVSPAPAR
ncbi:unnamed protein product [Rangifer tarandus platyrhynchus]|uniref:Uncharacterized protein n=2 Tax=Rangifer tarandus platyrhynchus TaxID=3082113 RepID=A0ACB0F734_RANTA|nr:unnamed protein product [Rangifer tarandus platyrhynchus]CAI9708673.1 unnamed protein product [Rangifer tarandus platyrhynchus]